MPFVDSRLRAVVQRGAALALAGLFVTWATIEWAAPNAARTAAPVALKAAKPAALPVAAKPADAAQPAAPQSAAAVSIVAVVHSAPQVRNVGLPFSSALPKLCLPKALYAFPGIELRVYFENLVPAERLNQLRFRVPGRLGTTHRRYWSATFRPHEAGVYPFEIVVCDLDGKELTRATSEVRVAPVAAGAGKALRLLIVGDSLTHATYYPNHLCHLFARPDNPKLTMLGTHKYYDALPGVLHEGYNGWTWSHFLDFYSPGVPTFGTPDKSPLLYPDAHGLPKVDLPRYLRTNAASGLPDLVIFELGINDVFSLPTNPDVFADKEFVVGNAVKLIKTFRAALPDASIAIWLTQPVNATQESFTYAYRGLDCYRDLKRSEISKRQHILVERLIERFGGREKEGLYLIPMCATVDPLDDYPADNAVHLSAEGYLRMGETVYAWMKWWLAHEDGSTRLLAADATQSPPAGESPNVTALTAQAVQAKKLAADRAAGAAGATVIANKPEPPPK